MMSPIGHPPAPPFTIDPRILAGSILIATLGLCDARLQADARWPWIVLIPRRAALRELDELTAAEQVLLLQEIARAGQVVRAIGEATKRPVEKLNIGALGNVVSQLHVHVVGRRRDDPAWPGPVWGFGEAQPYSEDTQTLLDMARTIFESSGQPA